MGIFSQLFRKGEDPEQSCTIDGLGTVLWSKDDEAWFGECNGFKFSLAYECTKTPVDELIKYGREILYNPDWLYSTLRDAKEKANRDFYGRNHDVAEIDGLSFERIHFYLYKGRRRILAHLEGGKDDRLWRIEYADQNCEGIGFDR